MTGNLNVPKQETCGRCKHGRQADPIKMDKYYCELRKRTVSSRKAVSCDMFEHRIQTSNWQPGEAGYPVRSVIRDDYRTLTQWAEVGFMPKPGCVGVLMCPVALARQPKRYWSSEDVFRPLEEQGWNNFWQHYAAANAGGKQRMIDDMNAAVDNFLGKQDHHE